MAGMAAVTSASKSTPPPPRSPCPAIVARMASTIDSISGGRFGVNASHGWRKRRYEQMGI
ncbi:hypothetical protein ACNKHS_06020 [Shigella flexneri]